MTDAATLTRTAADMATDVLAAAENPQQAVVICGLMAARIAAGANADDPQNSPAALLNTMIAAFNAAMSIETSGRIVPPRRQHLGFQE